MHESWRLLKLPQFFQQIACVKIYIYTFLPRTIKFIVTTVIEIEELLSTPEACKGGNSSSGWSSALSFSHKVCEIALPQTPVYPHFC